MVKSITRWLTTLHPNALRQPRVLLAPHDRIFYDQRSVWHKRLQIRECKFLYHVVLAAACSEGPGQWSQATGVAGDFPRYCTLIQLCLLLTSVRPIGHWWGVSTRRTSSYSRLCTAAIDARRACYQIDVLFVLLALIMNRGTPRFC